MSDIQIQEIDETAFPFAIESVSEDQRETLLRTAREIFQNLDGRHSIDPAYDMGTELAQQMVNAAIAEGNPDLLLKSLEVFKTAAVTRNEFHKILSEDSWMYMARLWTEDYELSFLFRMDILDILRRGYPSELHENGQNTIKVTLNKLPALRKSTFITLPFNQNVKNQSITAHQTNLGVLDGACYTSFREMLQSEELKSFVHTSENGDITVESGLLIDTPDSLDFFELITQIYPDIFRDEKIFQWYWDMLERKQITFNNLAGNNKDLPPSLAYLINDSQGGNEDSLRKIKKDIALCFITSTLWRETDFNSLVFPVSDELTERLIEAEKKRKGLEVIRESNARVLAEKKKLEA